MIEASVVLPTVYVEKNKCRGHGLKNADIEPPGIPMSAMLARREGRRALPFGGDGAREGGTEGVGRSILCAWRCWSESDLDWRQDGSELTRW